MGMVLHLKEYGCFCQLFLLQLGKPITEMNHSLKWSIVLPNGLWLTESYQQNHTINLDSKKGRHLAGDEWVEEFLVRPIKQYASAQSSFAMLELMSCSTNLLEMNREMYKSRDAFDIHNTTKHKKPSSVYDQLKVARFALEEWICP